MPKKQTMEKIVPDTSIIIEGLLSQMISKKEIVAKEIIISEALLAELEHQANQNKTTGFLGFEEVKKLQGLTEVKFTGERPKASEIKYASLGEIDSIIRKVAYENDATLITADKVQSKAAEAKGMKVVYIKQKDTSSKIALDKFFDETTMSVHLRENSAPYAKKGMPGQWDFVELRKDISTQDEIQNISREIIENTNIRKDGFIEIERPGSTIIQLGEYRIVICRPPFSDGWEITAVRPVKHLKLDDYKISEKLLKRMEEQAEGILIAGSPGMGKSTFAAALTEHYAGKGKIVKTIEAPRDLVLPENITQYAISHGSSQEVHDILLLSRPDYTLFDEMRNKEDFNLFADLRLSGIGLAGVVHATNPVDAIQRFVGKIELGVIPHIIDTVIFIKNGQIDKILSLQMEVKVPSGMTEADLARPVVTVKDFGTDKLEYELYSYGEETVVIPVKESKSVSGIAGLAAESIKRELRKYADEVEVEVISDNKCIVRVPESNIARIIGKEGKTISQIEGSIGMKIDVQELTASENEGSRDGKGESKRDGRKARFDIKMKKNSIVFDLGLKMQNKEVQIYLNDELMLRAKSGATGVIKIKKNNPIGRQLIKAYQEGEDISLVG